MDTFTPTSSKNWQFGLFIEFSLQAVNKTKEKTKNMDLMN